MYLTRIANNVWVNRDAVTSVNVVDDKVHVYVGGEAEPYKVRNIPVGKLLDFIYGSDTYDAWKESTNTPQDAPYPQHDVKIEAPNAAADRIRESMSRLERRWT